MTKEYRFEVEASVCFNVEAESEEEAEALAKQILQDDAHADRGTEIDIHDAATEAILYLNPTGDVSLIESSDEE